MKNLKLGKNIFLLTWILYIIYNTVYGWNKEPVDSTEEFLDFLTEVGFGAAIVIYTIPIFTLYKKRVEKMEADELKAFNERGFED